MNLYVDKELRDTLDRLARQEHSTRSAVAAILLRTVLIQLNEIAERATPTS
jgi:predicted transcriptional regulator